MNYSESKTKIAHIKKQSNRPQNSTVPKLCRYDERSEATTIMNIWQSIMMEENLGTLVTTELGSKTQRSREVLMAVTTVTCQQILKKVKVICLDSSTNSGRTKKDDAR